ncbi:ABC transporter substrate-binding protein [Thioclava kandeliae]|uniref:ABC transporter substrate-binding protein n=1 Tax=Thioclava kandeliae TaxID=3070818 RepID=A0ABV1SK38_9RHOB
MIYPRLLSYSILAAGLSLTATPALYAETLTITAAGGDYGTGLKEAMWGPASKELGLDIREESQSDSLAALRMQVMSKAVTTDVIHLGSAEAAQAADMGLLEKLDTSVVDMNALPEGARNDYCYPFDSYGTVMAWNTKTYGENGPKTWADFWDTKTYPGRRALRANAQDVLEIALLSEGVAPADIYKVLSSEDGIKRAVARLAELKPDVAIWWTSGAQSAQILTDGEVDMAATWNGRAAAAAEQGPADYTFKGSVIGTDCLAVPAGAPHAKDAMRLIATMTTPEREAKLTDYILYGPVNEAAYKTGLIPEDRMPKLATSPENLEGSVYADPSWWVKHGEDAQIAFDEMINN